MDPRPGGRIASGAVAPLNYQEMIGELQRYWADQGAVIMQPYHTELGAGTANPATFLRSLGPDPWKVAYVEPCIRPTDGRYGENPYRFQHYFQYQVLLKPAPENVLDLYFDSLAAIGVDLARHDVRLVEDDWEQPSIGAWGLGWEVWCDGMEITQFTYFQQVGGIELDVVPCEIDAEGGQRVEVEVEDVLRGRLEDHLILVVVLEAVGVLAVASVGRPDARLDVRGAPRLRSEAAEERGRIRRSGAELRVVRLEDHAALVGPVALQRGEHVLVVHGG